MKISQTCIKVKSDSFYTAIEKLTSNIKPSFKDEYESWWKYFYLPAKHKGKLICIPVSVFLSYKKVYYIKLYGFAQLGANLAVIDKGGDSFSEPYVSILNEISRFMPLIDKQGEKLLGKIYPDKWRSGEIKKKIYKRKR